VEELLYRNGSDADTADQADFQRGFVRRQALLRLSAQMKRRLPDDWRRVTSPH